METSGLFFCTLIADELGAGISESLQCFHSIGVRLNSKLALFPFYTIMHAPHASYENQFS